MSYIRVSIGGGLYAPSREEFEEWEQYANERTNFHMGNEDELDEDHARGLGEKDAYEKFGFSREHTL